MIKKFHDRFEHLIVRMSKSVVPDFVQQRKILNRLARGGQKTATRLKPNRKIDKRAVWDRVIGTSVNNFGLIWVITVECGWSKFIHQKPKPTRIILIFYSDMKG